MRIIYKRFITLHASFHFLALYFLRVTHVSAHHWCKCSINIYKFELCKKARRTVQCNHIDRHRQIKVPTKEANARRPALFRVNFQSNTITSVFSLSSHFLAFSYFFIRNLYLYQSGKSFVCPLKLSRWSCQGNATARHRDSGKIPAAAEETTECEGQNNKTDKRNRHINDIYIVYNIQAARYQKSILQMI